MSQTIEVPTALLRKFVRAGQVFDDFQSDLEDYLVSTNPVLLKKLRQARRQHRAGKSRTFDELKRELDLR